MVNEFSWFLSTSVLKKLLPSKYFFSKTPLSESARLAIIEQNSRDHTIWFDCSLSHNHICHIEVIRKIEEVLRNVWKVYAIVHVVPFLLFKRKELSKYIKSNDWKSVLGQLWRLAKGFSKSMSFIGMYTFFAMCNWCYTKNYFRGLSCKLNYY